MDTLTSIMKDGSIAGVCAQIVAKGATTISEHELVEAATKVAAERHPELSPAQAFAKVFTAGTDEARVLHSAIAVAKAATFNAFAPTQVGGNAAQDVDDPAAAIAQLKALGAQKYPSSSASDQFEKALIDPANHALARKAVPISASNNFFSDAPMNGERNSRRDSACAAMQPGARGFSSFPLGRSATGSGLTCAAARAQTQVVRR